MTTFDDRLAARLRTLDAAIPSPAAPDLEVGRAILRERKGRWAPGARRGFVLLVAIVALLVGTSVVIGGRPSYPEKAEPELEAALMELHAAQDCLSPADADARIRELFVSLGFKGWDVERTKAVGDDACVSTAVASDTHSVWLLPGYSHTAGEMFETLQAELLTRCLDRDPAIELVRTGMAGVGWPDIIISAGPDVPQAVPADEAEAARWYQHVAAGCYVLVSVASWEESGERTIYLWGE